MGACLKLDHPERTRRACARIDRPFQEGFDKLSGRISPVSNAWSYPRSETVHAADAHTFSGSQTGVMSLEIVYGRIQLSSDYTSFSVKIAVKIASIDQVQRDMPGMMTL